MKIVFMGTPDFAVASLDAIVKAGYNVAAVVTVPDKPAGRGQKLSVSAVKEYALAHNLPILQPEKLKDENFLAALKELNADVFVVVAFRKLPEAVWSMPPKGTFNLHGSLLPQYRGAAPINRAVMNGEKETGVTTFFIEKEIDTGKIIFSEKTQIGENETAGEVHDRLMMIGGELVVTTLHAIEPHNYKQPDQHEFVKDGMLLNAAPKIFKDDCRIDWNKHVNDIHNHIRGLSPYPTAFTDFVSPSVEKYSVKLFRCEKEIKEHSQQIGTITSDNRTYIYIAANGGFISVKELQLSGKKKLPVKDFLLGFKIEGNWKCE
ncbi:MAG: methionyl-tRNA formyltransferase [Bacteroidia bacterium]